MRKVVDHIIIALAGGLIYYGIEMLWRGRSDLSMIIVSAIIFVKSGMLDEGKRKYKFWQQVVIATAFATFVELIAGIILNVWLDLGIWDYSDVRWNFLGQICPQFSLAWAALLSIAMPLENAMHRVIDFVVDTTKAVLNIK